MPCCRGRPGGGRRVAHRHPRALGERQDHAAADAGGAGAGRPRDGGARGPGGRRAATFVRPSSGHRYVPQEGALFPHLTVSANVAFGLPRGRRRAARVTTCSRWSGWGAWAGGTPTSSRAASSSGWPWPGRWPSSRPWSCWTSPSPPSTPACVPRVRDDVRTGPAPGRHHGRAGHPRPGRGPVHGRPGGGDPPRPDRPVRDAREPSTTGPSTPTWPGSSVRRTWSTARWRPAPWGRRRALGGTGTGSSEVGGSTDVVALVRPGAARRQPRAGPDGTVGGRRVRYAGSTTTATTLQWPRCGWSARAGRTR